MHFHNKIIIIGQRPVKKVIWTSHFCLCNLKIYCLFEMCINPCLFGLGPWMCLATNHKQIHRSRSVSWFLDQLLSVIVCWTWSHAQYFILPLNICPPFMNKVYGMHLLYIIKRQIIQNFVCFNGKRVEWILSQFWQTHGNGILM